MRTASAVLLLAVLAAAPAAAQGSQPLAAAQQDPRGPQSYEVLGVSVEGVTEETTRQFVIQTAGIRAGQTVTLPGDEAVADAVRRLYELGAFTDVDVVAERYVAEGVFLLIRVEEAPRVGEYEFEGLKKGEVEDLRREIPLLRGRALRPADLERSEQVLKEYLADKGFRLARVEVEERPAPDNRTDLTFRVTKGPRVEVGDIRFFGNEAFGEGRLQKQLKSTKEDRWWRFWSRDTFEEDAFEEDLDALLRYYQDRGYYSARVVRDSVWLEGEGDDAEVVVDVYVAEGPQYHVRSVEFDGNTEYTDEQLRAALGVEPGELYNRSKIEENLYYNREHSDVFSLYQDRGYLRFNAQERIAEAPGDSLDIVFEIQEGDVYTFGEVTIAGNNRTKDHVIRRQLRTLPGATYSRQAIERSVRELVQLNYFDPEALGGGPRVSVDEQDKEVDLTYTLVETGGDQLELSGGWGGGGYGLILQARVTFNNFSMQGLFDREAWRPLPSGDGQQLSLGVQASGTRYQNYSLSFTEPYFRGKNTPVGFALSYTFRDLNSSRALDLNAADENSFQSLSGRLFYQQPLKWPDDFFQLGTSLNYRLYNVEGQTFTRLYRLPEGISQELSLRQSFSRNSFDNPIFPTAGSSFNLSAEVAVPIGTFNQYHKEQLTTTWVTPIIGKLSLQFSGDFGYIGALTGDEVAFQRFLVGGSPLDTQGGYLGYGKDLVFMRGYKLGGISPRQNGQLVGGRILNKYSLEARLFAYQSAQFSFAPYLFTDAANTWNSFDDYNPSELFRSVGVGAKVFLPILGLVDLNYGYHVDSYLDPRSGAFDEPSWLFQFSLGR